MGKFPISDLDDLKLRHIPEGQTRKVRHVENICGHVVAIGENGQLYHHDKTREYSPTSWPWRNRMFMRRLMELGVITEGQLEASEFRFQEAMVARNRWYFANQLTKTLEAVGIELTPAQQEKVNAIVQSKTDR